MTYDQPIDPNQIIKQNILCYSHAVHHCLILLKHVMDKKHKQFIK